MTTEKQLLPEVAVIGALWRTKWLILAVTILAAGAGYIATTLSTPAYQAEASVLFRFDREYSPRNLASDGWHGEPIRVNLDGAIHNDLEILGSRRLQQEALARMRAASAPTDRPVSADSLSLEEELGRIRSALSIRRVEGTSIARLTFTHADPVYASAFLAVLIETHLDTRGPYLNWSPSESIGEVVEWAEAQMMEAQGNLNAFRTETGILDAEFVRADLQGRLTDFRVELLRLGPDSPAAAYSEIAAGISSIESELATLTESEFRLEALTSAAESAAEQYRQARNILVQQELSERLATAQGPSIILLDQPATNPEPVGLSAVATAVLSGTVGFALSCLLGLWLARNGFGTSARKTETPTRTAPTVVGHSRRIAEPGRLATPNRAKSHVKS